MHIPERYNALVVRIDHDGQATRTIEEVGMDFLPDNEVLIHVKNAGLNYKDALSASGHRGVTRNYPHTPGVDAAGVVVDDRSGKWTSGTKVICTSYDLGMNTPGGFAEYIRVPADWVVPMPEEFSFEESMTLGTAAYTAALALYKMEMSGQHPEMGPVIVTGATGGVGSMAVALLAKAGYEVHATTGKKDKHDFLRQLGAAKVFSRDYTNDQSGKPLLRPQWAGAIDNVGGQVLATLLKACDRNGNVASIGLVGSPEFSTTVYPFILNGVNLLGVDSAETPYAIRTEIWKRLAGSWRLSLPEEMRTLVPLSQIPEAMHDILHGKTTGRVVWNGLR